MYENYSDNFNETANFQHLIHTKRIDDLGTGYSSLSYLHRLAVNSLKVNHPFVNQLPESKRNDRVAVTIVALSHQLELDAIVEGIETRSQLKKLQRLCL